MVYPHDCPNGPGLVQFHISTMVAGINQHQTTAITGILGGIRMSKNNKGIVLVAGSASGRRNRLDPVEQGPALGLTFSGMAAVEMKQFPLAKGQIQA